MQFLLFPKEPFGRCYCQKVHKDGTSYRYPVRIVGATTDLPKVAHPCVRSSVGVTSNWLDGWATLGKVFAGEVLGFQ